MPEEARRESACTRPTRILGPGRSAAVRSWALRAATGLLMAGAVLSVFAPVGCAPPASSDPLVQKAESPVPSEAAPVARTSVAEAVATAQAIPTGPPEQGSTLSIDTNLVVDRDVTVMARMGGIVESLHVDRGARVKQGDALLMLRNQDLRLLLDRAEIDLRQKRIDHQRVKALFEERTVSAAQLEEADLALKMAEVEVGIAREDLEKSYVRAPFDGVVAERYAKPGQRVVEDENIPLFRVTALGPLQARLYLSEEVARSLRRGDEAVVVPRYRASSPVGGTIEWVSRLVDASSGTIQTIVSVPSGNGEERLAPGMAVTVRLRVPSAAPGVLVPRAALDGDPYGPGTRDGRIKVMENGVASWRTVQVGALRGDQVEILTGLRAGETVALLHEGASGAGERR